MKRLVAAGNNVFAVFVERDARNGLYVARHTSDPTFPAASADSIEEVCDLMADIAKERQ